MSFYLLEIGCEELPASFVTLAADYLKKQAENELNNLHLTYDEIKSGGTPRRLYLYINGLPEKQADRVDTIQGPPAKIAFTADGKVSEAGLKFAESKGLDKNSLHKISTEKGEYLAGTKSVLGESTSQLLVKVVSNLIRTIPFPKTMRWGNKEIRFARPLHYILSLWNGQVLKLEAIEAEGIFVGTETTGHRFLAPQKFKIDSFEQYKKVLADNFVVVDEEERINSITSQMAALAAKGGYEVDQDAGLLNSVANLVEYPYAIEGKFDEQFLQLPAPVLITSMKHHQKYFPAYKNGKLSSTFIGISNMKPKDDEPIRGGYQRVLRARLNDAMFFYNNDKATPLENRVEMLKKVVYQEKLGTSYEKMERFRALALYIADIVAKDKEKSVYEAATLCKADLMCEMVYEFPELQGFMGRVYAKIQGKSEEIADAIEEHYMPRFAGDKLPESIAGKVIAISDKLDTITGAFAVGMIPSGNVDPYGLRRNAIGIINIIEEAGWKISLKDLIKESLELVKTKATEDLSSTKEKVLAFFIQRQKQLLINRDNVDADAFDAAAAHFDDLISQRDRAIALTKAKKSESFNSIAQSYKRINNILKKANITKVSVNEKLFEQEEERNLYKTYLDKKDSIKAYVDKERWDEALKELSVFAEPLNAFFDKVMVMTENQEVKNNRLSLLAALKELFVTVGDLSEII